MTKKPKTIITYLIDGLPNGFKTLSILNKTCKSLIIPRSAMDKIKDREELSQPSLYFLLNDKDTVQNINCLRTDIDEIVVQIKES
jgi:hypothetical protein